MFNRQKRTEIIVYVIIWLVVFLFEPGAQLYNMISYANGMARFSFHEVLDAWGSIMPFFVLFLVHTIFIAPLLGKKNRIWVYGALVVASLCAFQFYHAAMDRVQFNKYVRPMIERAAEEREKAMKRWEEWNASDSARIAEQKWEQFNQVWKKVADSLGISPAIADSARFYGRGPDMRWERGMRPDGGREDRGEDRRDNRRGGDRGFGWGPRFSANPFGPFSPALFKLFVALMMLAANVGVKMFFRAQANEKRMTELENENIDQQLQYLRYQINPHFFMNTLNNIHALVDIEPEQAKTCILELSKLMRYLLYEGGKPTIPLSREVEFLDQYISLMKIRFTDNVRIDATFPESTSGVEIPPLLFVSFVENAFKHGISYKNDSFISVTMETMGDKLHFACLNSLNETNDDPHSGIGLENVRKRLGLLYGNDYSLDITQNEDSYSVQLDVPLKTNITTKI